MIPTKIDFISIAEMSKLVRHDKHQGVIAEVEEFVYKSLPELKKILDEKNEPAFIAVLDHIEDPHNLGAIIRSAEASGVHGIIIPKDQAAEVTPVVEKSAAGATTHLPIIKVTNLVRTIDDLKKVGIWFYGTDQDGEQSIEEIDISGPCGIVLGGEGKGMRRLVREHCDIIMRIPMYGNINSLNVSVSAGITFYEVRRQRRKKL